MATQKVPTKVVTSKVRFSYVHAWEPAAVNEGDKPKYSVSIIIKKTDKVLLDKIEAAINAAIELGKAKLGGKTGKVPKNLKTPLRDGDEERADDPSYMGCMFINANSNQQPEIVDADRNPILIKSEFYSGCYGRASINFYAFDSNGNKGIAAGLGNLQKLEDGERLSGGSTADEDFADDDDDLM